MSKWNELVKSFENWDVYYLFEYAHSFYLHGDGEPLLISYQDQESRFCYVVMKSDIADCPLFKGILEKGKCYDFSTPYGYGGPLSDGKITTNSQLKFKAEIIEYARENNIVSQFVRFHPLLNNFDLLNEVIETRYMRDTIYIDTSDSQLIMDNMDSKNRNMVRKAIKSGVEIVVKDITKYGEFIDMYEETMKNNDADDYYIFKEEYFKDLVSLKDNACIFYAMLDGKPISASIMYYNEKFMHYHLSGTHFEYRKYSPGNLLLYQAGVWASKRGISAFHLGGGMSPDDSLFGFKKQFNKNGRLPFYIGRTIFDEKAKEELLNYRKKADQNFDKENGFMISYRKP